ncbi:MAG: asparaginase domain-containing protein, partial [Eubacterium sp.]|nr:asparaginase domain-containing protein [Eubacterium sp.]
MEILVIFTGGTIGSSTNNQVISPNEKNTRLLIEMYKNEYGTDIQFITAQPYYTLSENNTGKTLLQLISFVCDKTNDDYSGIIVTHGTDTLQFSAAALSYALGANCKPVM